MGWVGQMVAHAPAEDSATPEGSVKVAAVVETKTAASAAGSAAPDLQKRLRKLADAPSSFLR